MGELKDQWNSGDRYEYFMGRWSSLMAREFLTWLNMPAKLNWLDVGCGTGALSEAIEKSCDPLCISGVEPSADFIEKASKRISVQGEFRIGEAEKLPFADDRFDVIVSGLALNFFPNTEKALSEMKRVSKPSGVIAAYVWDYSGRMDFLRYFWDAAYQVDPSSKSYDEGIRFSICNSENLLREFRKVGLSEVEASFLDIKTVFSDFDDYWKPFLGGQGPAPGFLRSLSRKKQDDLKEKILERINFTPDGSFEMIGRALVVKGIAKQDSKGS